MNSRQLILFYQTRFWWDYGTKHLVVELVRSKWYASSGVSHCFRDLPSSLGDLQRQEKAFTLDSRLLVPGRYHTWLSLQNASKLCSAFWSSEETHPSSSHIFLLSFSEFWFMQQSSLLLFRKILLFYLPETLMHGKRKSVTSTRLSQH